jgi:aspartyl/asparaginyl beta-hydroxylase (cupin superfamily)
VTGARPGGGDPTPCNAEAYPATCRTLERMSLVTGLHVRVAQFSEISPGTHIRPHCGSSNTRVAMHLGVQIEKAAAESGALHIRVVGQKHGWEELKAVAFDDSFEHEVVNLGTQRRVVLLCHVDHPHWRAQQETLSAKKKRLEEEKAKAQEYARDAEQRALTTEWAEWRGEEYPWTVEDWDAKLAEEGEWKFYT